MIIAVDIDEVLADLVSELTEFHNRTYGTSFTNHDYASYDLEDTWGGTRTDAVQKVERFMEEGGFRRAKPKPGAKRAIDTLKKTNELVVVSSRFHTLDTTTKEWLDEHFPNLFNDVHLTNHYGNGAKRKKSDVCHETGATHLIEDNLEMALEAAAQGIHVLLFDAPWNQHENLPENITRVQSWDDIVAFFQS